MVLKIVGCQPLWELLEDGAEEYFCKLVWKNCHMDYEDNRMNSAGARKTMITAPDLSGPREVVLAFFFQQAFSMKSIVSWPLECNFPPLPALSSWWDWDRYCMKWCTLLWLCLTFMVFFFPFLHLLFFFSFFFFSECCFVLFPSGLISSFI